LVEEDEVEVAWEGGRRGGVGSDSEPRQSAFGPRTHARRHPAFDSPGIAK
jgi:hypothetical protein